MVPPDISYCRSAFQHQRGESCPDQFIRGRQASRTGTHYCHIMDIAGFHLLSPHDFNQKSVAGTWIAGETSERPAGVTWTADPREVDLVAIASDGAGALPELRALAADVAFRNPVALTRRLSLLAEDAVEIDWDERRVVRRPALLDDDTTIAIARWSRP